MYKLLCSIGVHDTQLLDSVFIRLESKGKENRICHNGRGCESRRTFFTPQIPASIISVDSLNIGSAHTTNQHTTRTPRRNKSEK